MGHLPLHRDRSDLDNVVAVFISEQLAASDLDVILLPSNK